MTITIKPGWRAPLVGLVAAGLLVGSFVLGTAQASPSTDGSQTVGPAVVTGQAGDGKITVTGTGTATGTPNQLVLSMGVQVSSYSVPSAVAQANQAQRRVIAALKAH